MHFFLRVRVDAVGYEAGIRPERTVRLLHLLQGKQRGFWGMARLWSWLWRSGWQPFCWWRHQGTQPSTGPLQPSAPPEGSPGTSCPRISASGRSAQPSGAEPAGLVWSAAKGKRLRCHCGTGPRDQTITPPHLETHLFTFCHFLTGYSCVDRKGPIKDPHLTNLHQ